MSSSKNSNSGMAVPEAKEAMRQFKEEVASELGVNLKDGYNGDLTSREAGSIGGEMVKKMIMRQEEQMTQYSFALLGQHRSDLRKTSRITRWNCWKIVDFPSAPSFWCVAK